MVARRCRRKSQPCFRLDILPSVWCQPRHARRNSDTFCSRQPMTAVPLLPREVDPVAPLDPQLRREIIPRQNVVQPVRSVLPEPRLLVLVADQGKGVTQILEPPV